MSARERVISIAQTIVAFRYAVNAAERDTRDVTWIKGWTGQVVAAMIPARNYHPPHECCCKNCPWNNDHREKT